MNRKELQQHSGCSALILIALFGILVMVWPSDKMQEAERAAIKEREESEPARKSPPKAPEPAPVKPLLYQILGSDRAACDALTGPPVDIGREFVTYNIPGLPDGVVHFTGGRADSVIIASGETQNLLTLLDRAGFTDSAGWTRSESLKSPAIVRVTLKHPRLIHVHFDCTISGDGSGLYAPIVARRF